MLPGDIERWHTVERTFRQLAERSGYGEVRTPYLEPTELFVREIGEATDVVEKEMYSFAWHSEAMTLRPEGTAGAARAFVEHKVHAREPVTRWYYLGPMFRGERPAKGRYRQFWQAGCEVYGDASPVCDAELIAFCADLLRALGIDQFAVHVNTIGGAEARASFRERLFAHLEPLRASLSQDSQRRLDKNPLRILDSKDARDQELCADAPSLLDCLSADDRAHHDRVLRLLAALGVDVVQDAKLVRGLDYYTRTLFELRATAADLGAQSALLGGGRYDGMVQSLGGPTVPAVGFAMGIERILAASKLAAPARVPTVFLAPLGERAQDSLLGLAVELRRAGVRALLDCRGGSLKSLLRRADGLGAAMALIAGDGELDRGEITLKSLASGAQEACPRAAVVERVVARLEERRGSA